MYRHLKYVSSILNSLTQFREMQATNVVAGDHQIIVTHHGAGSTRPSHEQVLREHHTFFVGLNEFVSLCSFEIIDIALLERPAALPMAERDSPPLFI